MGTGETDIPLSDLDLEVSGLRYFMSKFDQSGVTLARLIKSQYMLTNGKAHQ